MSFLETDSCSGAQINRRIPDDYAKTGQVASTDFGSRGERVFALRSVGKAPLTVREIALSELGSEFSMTVADADGNPVELPVLLTADADLTSPPDLVVTVNYAAVDSTPERSFSDLLSNSRAALATTGCTPSSPRCGVIIMAASVTSIERLGSDRKAATPARVLSASA